MTDESDGTEGLTPADATRLHRGAALEEGPYRLRYNVDGNGWYYLEFTGEVHKWTYAFDRVERDGEDAWDLAPKHEHTGMIVDGVRQGYPLLFRAFVTIAQATPNQRERRH